MPNKINIESALAKMREVLELVNRSDPDKRDAILRALQASLQALVDLDHGSAAVVLSTDFKGSMGLYTLNANEETVAALAESVLTQLGHVRLDDLPVEQMGAVQ